MVQDTQYDHKQAHLHVSDRLDSSALGFEGLMGRLLDVRAQTEALAEGLTDADSTVQSMPDASPAKWHLAHTSWFFETFVLRSALPEYEIFDAQFPYLFNSYYEQAGARHPRARRGMLTRPTLDRVLAYRAHVDRGLRALEGVATRDSLRDLLELGLHHEQQHQELLLTDILHLFAENPLKPVYRETEVHRLSAAATEPFTWVPLGGGDVMVGARAEGFAFDCERPRHKRLLPAFELASRPVTNRDWIEFIEAGGYRDPLLWLSDGWALVSREGWAAPLYWRNRDTGWMQMTLNGERAIELDAPVCHVSYFEADAFASWAGARLPREEEWEAAAALLVSEQPKTEAEGSHITGHFADKGRFRPARPSRALGSHTPPFYSLFGDVWEWTQSAFTAYPGFKPLEGAPGEYNGKFMSGQFVLKGGSCVTPSGHVRASYRNFFYPHQRWQFTGLRLARDVISSYPAN